MLDQPPAALSVARSPLVVRAAEWVGKTLGRWRRDWHERRDVAYIAAWKTAWTQGCEARWAGGNRDDVPHRSGPQRDAWLAGWNWADIQPDRRDTTRLSAHAYTRRRVTDLESGSS
jgi:ribosome modulation factor